MKSFGIALVVIIPVLLLAQALIAPLPRRVVLITDSSGPVPTVAPVKPAAPKPGDVLARSGDEIMVCGQLFHTGTPVVLWTDPGGYDAYRTELRYGPVDDSPFDLASKLNKELKTPNRYGLRKDALTPEQIERVRGGGWDLPLLQKVVDQFVLHYDQSGTSRRCFEVLHDRRCLSIHFMLDLDGTIYQTLDLKERAWHATTSNTRSIGVEIANLGGYEVFRPSVRWFDSVLRQIGDKSPLNQWYVKDSEGLRIKFPADFPAPNGGQRTPGFIARPAQPEPIVGDVQGKTLKQYDFTPQQYDALIKLTATLCRVFPKITCDYPHNDMGSIIREKLPDEQLKTYQGILGHYHIQTNKIDPGPALDWEKIVSGVREILDDAPAK
jgi:N-acetylmuramoyl-L-alanine amidase